MEDRNNIADGERERLALLDRLTALAGFVELCQADLQGQRSDSASGMLAEALLSAHECVKLARHMSGLPPGSEESADALVAEEPEPYGQQRVLVIDDDPGICYIAQRTLERKGYRVRTTTDPEEGLLLFREQPSAWDMVVVDLTLPEISGTEVCRRLEAIDPKVRILMMSGYSIGLEYQELLDKGIRRFLPKPFLPRDLTMKVREVLDEEAEER